MSNFNIDDYIKEMVLSSELEEKARQCKTSRGQVLDGSFTILVHSAVSLYFL